MSEEQNKRAVLIIAKEIFRDEELFDTQDALEKAGVETVVASSKLGTCKGKLGATAEATVLVSDISEDDYDAIVFVGGGGSAEYFDNPDALELAKDAVEKDKVVAAICIAPRTLANAGLLKGKKATCFESERDNIIELGALFEDAPVVRDGKIITGSGPHAATKFGETIAQVLGVL